VRLVLIGGIYFMPDYVWHSKITFLTFVTFMMQMPKKTPGVSPWDEFGIYDNKYHNSSETPSVSSGSFIT